MKRNEMNWFQLAIFKAIKEHCTKESYLEEYKPTEFISMEESERKQVRCCFPHNPQKNNVILTHYTVKTKFKTEIYASKTVIWDICIYSNGECGIYFDGIEYRK